MEGRMYNSFFWYKNKMKGFLRGKAKKNLMKNGWKRRKILSSYSKQFEKPKSICKNKRKHEKTISDMEFQVSMCQRNAPKH